MNRFLFNGASVPIVRVDPLGPILLLLRFEVGKNCWQDEDCTIQATKAGDPVAVWKNMVGPEKWKLSNAALELVGGKLTIHGKTPSDFVT